MKYIFLLIILFFTFCFEIKGQEFVEYLSHFRNVELPLTVDRKTYNSIFYPTGNYSEISKDFVRKFIYPDKEHSCINLGDYRYDYGVKFTLNNYQIVIIHKQKYEGTTPYDFDLSEVLFVTYSKRGNVLSVQAIGKDNDGWISSTHINTDSIYVKQIKILEFNKPEMKCEIKNKIYLLTKDGIIKNVYQEPLKKGIVTWNEQIEDFGLK